MTGAPIERQGPSDHIEFLGNQIYTVYDYGYSAKGHVNVSVYDLETCPLEIVVTQTDLRIL